MRIGILTLYYKNYNYGGLLQAYALCKYLNRFTSIECEQIAYDYKRRKKSIKSWMFSIYSCIFHPQIMFKLEKRKKLFKTFEKLIPHSEVIDSSEKLGDTSSKYDYVFTGSDQVWNPEYAGEVFYLEEIPAIKRCAYAASFGKDQLTENILTEKIIQTIKKYKFISVREASAKKILERYGIDNVSVVCDPTLLLKKEEWVKNIQKINRIVPEKYVFIYFLGNSKSLRDNIKKKFEGTNLKIVFIPHIHFTYQKRDRGFADIEVYEAGPLEFLRLIYDAEMVVTDSFHCTLFSILFGKEFWTLSRNEKANIGSTNGRMYTLLEKAGLMERYAGTVSGIRLNTKRHNAVSNNSLKEYVDSSRKLLVDFLVPSDKKTKELTECYED